MNAIEMALEALENPSVIAVQHAIDLIKQELAKPEQEAYGYAKRLAEFIWEKHYKKESPDWTPLPDVLGVLTQIDNMTCGLEKAKPEQNHGFDRTASHMAGEYVDIAEQHAIDLLRKIKHPFIYFHPDSLQTSTFLQDGYIALYAIDGADYE